MRLAEVLNVDISQLTSGDSDTGLRPSERRSCRAIAETDQPLYLDAHALHGRSQVVVAGQSWPGRRGVAPLSLLTLDKPMLQT